MLSVTALSEEPLIGLQDSIKDCESGLDEWKEIAAHQGDILLIHKVYRPSLTTTRRTRTNRRDLQKNR